MVLTFGLIIFFFRKHAATACQDRNVRYELNIELNIIIWRLNRHHRSRVLRSRED